MQPDPGSYRDPAGRIFSHSGRILRAIMQQGAADFEQARSSGVLEKLAASGLMLPAMAVDPQTIPTIAGAVHVVEHPKLPYVSYPYEWCFPSFKAAAIHHLDVHLAALKGGFTLRDASAYNIQFMGTRPVFIDHLSLQPYTEGMIWEGHRQFCAQFLNPLILWSKLGISPSAWLRGSLEGIPAEELAALLRTRQKLSWTVLTHVVGLAALNKRQVAGGQNSKVKRPSLSRNALLGMLSGLKSYISGLSGPQGRTEWGDYASNTSYSGDEAKQKHALVTELVSVIRPNLFYDLGCNSGDYSKTAMEAGARNFVGFDFDYAALEAAYARFSKSGSPFLPLWMDASNPSPSQGWAQKERKGFSERGPADALVALALVHHLAIGKNVPLAGVVRWLMSLAPSGIIEFPAKWDAMVQLLLANRTDIFDDYSEEVFLNAIRSSGRIEKLVRLPENGRLLVIYTTK